MAKPQNTFEKRRREVEKRQRAAEKLARRRTKQQRRDPLAPATLVADQSVT
jgi:hypothetical protein